MELVLHLSGAPQDAAEISGIIRIDDQSEADAPARLLAQHPFGPVPLAPGNNTVSVSLPDDRVAAGASLNIRAEVRDARGGVARFLNTSAVQAPTTGTGTVSARLERI